MLHFFDAEQADYHFSNYSARHIVLLKDNIDIARVSSFVAGVQTSTLLQIDTVDAASIYAMQNVSCHPWYITDERQHDAIMTASRLKFFHHPTGELYVIAGDDMTADTLKTLEKRLEPHELSIGLVVDGQALARALYSKLEKCFFKAAGACGSAICYDVSRPLSEKRSKSIRAKVISNTYILANKPTEPGLLR
jgi:hypothetical protein